MSTDTAGGARHLLARLPMWAFGVLMAVVFGGLMFLATGRDDGVPAWQSLLIYGLLGTFFGAGMSIALRIEQRRAFAGVDGRITLDQKIQVLRAVDEARWPADRALRPAAISLARTRLRRAQSTRAQLILFGLFLLLSVYNAISMGPFWWLSVLFWAVISPWSITASRRQRRAAQALLDQHLAETPPS